MKLHIEPTVAKGRFWQAANILAKEAFTRNSILHQLI